MLDAPVASLIIGTPVLLLAVDILVCFTTLLQRVRGLLHRAYTGVTNMLPLFTTLNTLQFNIKQHLFLLSTDFKGNGIHSLLIKSFSSQQIFCLSLHFVILFSRHCLFDAFSCLNSAFRNYIIN